MVSMLAVSDSKKSLRITIGRLSSGLILGPFPNLILEMWGSTRTVMVHHL